MKLKIFFKYIDQFVDAVNSLTIAKIKIILELVYNLEHNYKAYPDISFHAFFTKLYVDVKLVDK